MCPDDYHIFFAFSVEMLNTAVQRRWIDHSHIAWMDSERRETDE
jgi:hypothetical protein